MIIRPAEPTMTHVPLGGPADLRAFYPARNIRFIVQPDAVQPAPGRAWLTDEGSHGSVIENVELIDRSAPPPADQRRPHGFNFLGVRGLRADRLRVDIPGDFAIRVVGGEELEFDRASTKRCRAGFKVDSQWTEPTVWLRLRRLVTTDNAQVSKLDYPSLRHSGEYMGTNGWNLHGVVHAEVEDCFAGGEISGVKMNSVRFVSVRRCHFPNIHVQGTIGRDGNPDRARMHMPEGSYGNVLEDCRIWKVLATHPWVGLVNIVQVSQNSELLIRRCDIRGDFASDGHGIQAATNAHVRVEGGAIGGCHGRRGRGPAAAFDHTSDSSITPVDVELWGGQREWSERVLAARAEG